jgi:hypothetical protein
VANFAARRPVAVVVAVFVGPARDDSDLVDHRVPQMASGKLRHTDLTGKPREPNETPPPGFRVQVFNSPTQQKVAFCAWGRSKRVSAMTHKAITLKFVVPAVFAVVLGISIGAVKYLVSVDQAGANRSVAGNREMAELPNLQLSRVRLLVSSMK